MSATTAPGGRSSHRSWNEPAGRSNAVVTSTDPDSDALNAILFLSSPKPSSTDQDVSSFFDLVSENDASPPPSGVGGPTVAARSSPTSALVASDPNREGSLIGMKCS